jgi:hypothetical protein
MPAFGHFKILVLELVEFPAEMISRIIKNDIRLLLPVHLNTRGSTPTPGTISSGSGPET